MAEFKGTVQEFHHFVGPRIKNLINNFTRLHRRGRRGVCEFCQNIAVLQSAHVHGRDRRTIIEGVLSTYTCSNGIVTCQIEKVEAQILSAHEPIKNTFKFICQPCHTKYDFPDREMAGSELKKNGSTPAGNGEFLKIGRISRWAARPNQINHKIIRAFLELETSGEVVKEDFLKYCMDSYGIKNAEQHFASMKTDNGNSHGKVFYEESGLVKLWEPARIEIEEYFPQT